MLVTSHTNFTPNFDFGLSTKSLMARGRSLSRALHRLVHVWVGVCICWMRKRMIKTVGALHIRRRFPFDHFHCRSRVWHLNFLVWKLKKGQQKSSYSKLLTIKRPLWRTSCHCLFQLKSEVKTSQSEKETMYGWLCVKRDKLTNWIKTQSHWPFRYVR